MSGAPRPLIFVAYTLAAETASVCAAWARDSLGDASGLRLVPAGNLHVTLVFCGRVPAERVRKCGPDDPRRHRGGSRPRLHGLARAGACALGGRAQLKAAEPDRGLRGWPLGTLALELSNAGLRRPETREWLPHLTVARGRRGQRPSVGAEPPSASFAPDAIAVLESVTVPGGVCYEERARFPLHDG